MKGLRPAEKREGEKMELLEIVELTGGEEGAFCPDKIAHAGLNDLQVLDALQARIAPLAGLLRNDCGFAVVVNGDDGKVVGVREHAETPKNGPRNDL